MKGEQACIARMKPNSAKSLLSNALRQVELQVTSFARILFSLISIFFSVMPSRGMCRVDGRKLT
jgi:hypothetical protein